MGKKEYLCIALQLRHEINWFQREHSFRAQRQPTNMVLFFCVFLIRFKHCQFRVIFSTVFILICCFLCGFYFTIKYLAIFTVRVFFRLSFVSNISFIFSAFPAFFKIFSPRDPCSAHGSWITKYKLIFINLGPFSPCLIPKLYVKRRRMIIVVASHWRHWYILHDIRCLGSILYIHCIYVVQKISTIFKYIWYTFTHIYWICIKSC